MDESLRRHRLGVQAQPITVEGLQVKDALIHQLHQLRGTVHRFQQQLVLVEHLLDLWSDVRPLQGFDRLVDQHIGDVDDRIEWRHLFMRYRGGQSLLVDHPSSVLLSLDESVDVVDEYHCHYLLPVLHSGECQFVYPLRL